MHPTVTRREALSHLSAGVGGIGLSAFLAQQHLPADAGPAGRKPHHEPKARGLIFLNMMGGPSQFETFDHKPAMAKYAGKNVKVEGARNVGNNPILPGVLKFAKHGQAGLECSEVFPHLAKCMDELCVIKSMTCEDNNHPGAQREIMTGFNRKPMPSFGSWITYGLGSENKDLPGFVYLAEGNHHDAGFLPAVNQGMPLSSRLPNLRRPGAIAERQQREQLDLANELNRLHAERRQGEGDLTARIEAGELAFRMQTAAPEALGIDRESSRTLALYGIGGGGGRARAAGRGLTLSTSEFGTMCLVARRLVERGVRVVTINVGGRRGWDQHGNLKAGVTHNASVIDQPIAGLLTDLKSRGLLDRTLVLWGGEFGRTPNMQTLAGDSRAHHTRGYTMWLAGGGSKRGTSYGKTDELGTDVAEGKVHVHDLHATILHLMGLDHEKLTYRYAGRDQRLTDVSGKVVRGVLA